MFVALLTGLYAQEEKAKGVWVRVCIFLCASSFQKRRKALDGPQIELPFMVKNNRDRRLVTLARHALLASL